jgi:MinD-like ATPase involved in chromosome partitioning or flagellar assembly
MNERTLGSTATGKTPSTGGGTQIGAADEWPSASWLDAGTEGDNLSDAMSSRAPRPQAGVIPERQRDDAPGRRPAAEPGQRPARSDTAVATQAATTPVRSRTVADPGLDEGSIVRGQADRPSSGWRALLYMTTGGRINPGPSADQRLDFELDEQIRRQLHGAHHIAVASTKGGVGKTTVAACLGLVLAENRGDRVVVIDANPDAGTLADRLTTETSVTIRDMLRTLPSLNSLTEVSRYTSLAGRLQVLASEQDPAAEAFSRDEYLQVMSVLSRFFNISITDSGTGLVHSAMDGTLELASSLIIAANPTVDGASRAQKTLDWLDSRGHRDVVKRAVVALSYDRSSHEVNAEQIVAYFESRCRAVVEIPYDPHLAVGGRISLPALHPTTVSAFRQLAACVAEEFR